ncbi:MAG: FAD-dependent oxidoreductase [Clostridia bacterium]
MLKVKLVIVGGGPAGLAAAKSAYDAGERDILILEREAELGGILNQCIHNGFGLHTFKEELTGPEYAQRYVTEILARGIIYKLNATVIDVSEAKIVTYVSSSDGLVQIQAEAIILSCGCRERPRGAINIAGGRGAGIFNAGTAQKLVNIDGYMPGKEVVILGSGDIGLIMARRMTFEGAVVKAVVELMPYSSGLNRNIVQCLVDFNIPLMFNHTIIDVRCTEVNEKLQPKLETAQEIKCDTLLLSVGLLPENELAKNAGVKLHNVTGGAEVTDQMMTNIEGVFECGNVLHVHDLVDFVSEEAEHAGLCAVKYIQGAKVASQSVTITAQNGVRYVVPQKINLDDDYSPINLKMRVGNVYKKVDLTVTVDGVKLYSKRRLVVTPGEMETVSLTSEQVKKLKSAKSIVVELQGGAQ